MTTVRLKRIYRRYKALRTICFILSVEAAVAPSVLAAIKVAPVLKDTGSRWGLAGYAVIILVLAGLIIWRGLSKKYAHKLPWALSVSILSWGLVALLTSLQRIISQALYISIAFAIGATVALVLSVLCDLFSTLAANVREELKIQRIREGAKDSAKDDEDTKEGVDNGDVGR